MRINWQRGCKVLYFVNAVFVVYVWVLVIFMYVEIGFASLLTDLSAALFRFTFNEIYDYLAVLIAWWLISPLWLIPIYWLFGLVLRRNTVEKHD